jgi:Uma2 family endonuclease
MHSAQAEECQIEIINGREEVRNLGEYEHSSMQTMLAFLLGRNDKARETRTLVEQSIRIHATTKRIPDIAVFQRSTPIEPVFTAPPETIFEILSRKDRISRYEERIDDYMSFGVRRIYVIDPYTWKAWNVSDGSWIRTDRFDITDAETLLMSDLIAALKEQQA